MGPRAAEALAAVLVLAAVTSCCAPSGVAGWGGDVTAAPGWHRAGQAAKGALLSPGTLVPAAAALLVQIGDVDREISDWAARDTPLFGSNDRARRASDDLAAWAGGACLVTALATPSGGGARCIADKCKGLAVGASAETATEGVVTLLKRWTGRVRPDESNSESFPSAHASSSATFATLASRNLGAIDMPAAARVAANALVAGLAAGTAWARVEGRRHFVSDVLAGAAIGHFIAAFANDAFLEPGDGSPAISLEWRSGSQALAMEWSF